MFKNPPIWLRYNRNGSELYFEIRWSFFAGAAAFAGMLWLLR